MKIGYLQFEPEFGNPERNISKIETLTSDKDFDLLVLPELANSGYLFSNKKELEESAEEVANGKFCNSLRRVCSDKKSYIVSGLCERAGNKFYNSAVLVCPDGRVYTYRKIHLFDEEKLWFEPGNLELKVHEISGNNFGKVKIGLMVCFDWIFPETARTLTLKGAQIICHPSNLVLGLCQNAMFARAVENRIFTITSNRIGKDTKKDKELSFAGESVIINPKGKYLCRGSADKEEVCIAEINPDEALDKNITGRNHLMGDRRKEFYELS